MINVGQIPEIEVVMKLDGRWQKGRSDLFVQLDGGFDDVESVSFDHRMKVADFQMRRENRIINRLQSVEIREGNGEHGEMTLKSGGSDTCMAVMVGVVAVVVVLRVLVVAENERAGIRRSDDVLM